MYPPTKKLQEEAIALLNLNPTYFSIDGEWFNNPQYIEIIESLKDMKLGMSGEETIEILKNLVVVNKLTIENLQNVGLQQIQNILNSLRESEQKKVAFHPTSSSSRRNSVTEALKNLNPFKKEHKPTAINISSPIIFTPDTQKKYDHNAAVNAQKEAVRLLGNYHGLTIAHFNTNDDWFDNVAYIEILQKFMIDPRFSFPLDVALNKLKKYVTESGMTLDDLQKITAPEIVNKSTQFQLPPKPSNPEHIKRVQKDALNKFKELSNEDFDDWFNDSAYIGILENFVTKFSMTQREAVYVLKELVVTKQLSLKDRKGTLEFLNRQNISNALKEIRKPGTDYSQRESEIQKSWFAPQE